MTAESADGTREIVLSGSTLKGTSGIPTGGSENDNLYGLAGAGRDTALFPGASTDYTWSRNSNGSWSVTSSADGLDTLVGIELLAFSDKVFDISTGTAVDLANPAAPLDGPDRPETPEDIPLLLSDSFLFDFSAIQGRMETLAGASALDVLELLQTNLPEFPFAARYGQAGGPPLWDDDPFQYGPVLAASLNARSPEGGDGLLI